MIGGGGAIRGQMWEPITGSTLEHVDVQRLVRRDSSEGSISDLFKVSIRDSSAWVMNKGGWSKGERIGIHGWSWGKFGRMGERFGIHGRMYGRFGRRGRGLGFKGVVGGSEIWS